MNFEFATAQRILFGAGTVRQVPEAARGMGRRVFVLTGKTPERATALLDAFRAVGLAFETHPVPGEPTVPMAIAAVDAARRARCDMVVGFGGGSVLDLCKVVAALLTNSGDLMTYLEVVGEGRAIANQPAPTIAIPTTAGTGAEVTRNAVLVVPEHQRKVSMRSPLMLPTLAVVDPELTYSVPPALTATTGLDALTQVIEPFVSCGATPLTDGLCREGIRRAARSLQRACKDGRDPAAREDMAIASLCGGLALANAKLGAVHGFAGPLGGEFPAPHGAVCGRLLPHVMEANLHALRNRAPESERLGRFNELGPLLTGDPQAGAVDAVAWLHALVRDLAIPPLGTYGLTGATLPALAEKARTSSSMQGNPIALTQEELIAILEQAT